MEKHKYKRKRERGRERERERERGGGKCQISLKAIRQKFEECQAIFAHEIFSRSFLNKWTMFNITLLNVNEESAR